MSSVSSSTSTSPNSGPSKEKLDSEGSVKDISSHSLPKDTEENSTTAQEITTEKPSEKDTETIELNASGSAIPGSAASSTPWQAIYSPQYNAYYFFNPETNETTWENPLVTALDSTTPNPALENPTESLSSAVAPAEEVFDGAALSSYNALQAAAIAQGIDPSLAHLDPSLAGPIPGSSSGAYGAAAKFNARTGQFTRLDGRDPSHLSEYERAKRMSEFYFDVNAWEKQRAHEQEAEAEEAGGNEKKRKRPSKKDLERFKEQKKQKKIAKTAWLRT